MNETWKKYAGKLKGPKALMLLGACGLVLILLSALLPSGKTAAEPRQTPSVSAEEYRQSLEESVRQLVGEITGDRDATVVVTLESGVRYAYADAKTTDSSNTSGQNSEQASSKSTQSYITVRTADGGEEALLVTELMPEVRGVAVVCAGGDNEQTAEKIRSAVMAAFDITSKRVYIAGGNSYEKR